MHINDIVSHPRFPSILWLFMSHVKPGRHDECRVWTGPKSVNRGAKRTYGITSVTGKNVAAHRVSYAIFRGPVPSNLSVLHRCDNPLCVNPWHLFLGNKLDNSLDMAVKKRSAYGTRNARSKHNEETVRQVYAAKGRHADIAAQFGMCKSTVDHIKSGRQWSHITGQTFVPTSRARKLSPARTEFQNTGRLPSDISPAAPIWHDTDPGLART